MVATVVSVASCSLFLEPEHTHSLTKVEGKAATCTETGIEAYYTCSCEKLFADAEGTVEITAPKVIEKLDHSYTVETANADTLKSGADCTNAAVYYKSCSCGEISESETFISGSSLGHDYTEKIEDEAHLKAGAENCQSVDTYWYDCSRCESISDEDYFSSTTTGAHKVSDSWTNENGEHYNKCTVDGCTHVENKAACSDVDTDSDHLCDTCNASCGTHSYGEWVKNDASTHKQVCNCGAEKTQAHAWDEGVIDPMPTCQAEGVKTFTCTICGEKKTDSVGITGHVDKDNNYECDVCQAALCTEHTEATRVENETAATCTSTGSYDKVTYCSVCDKELDRETVIVNKIDHTSATKEENRLDATCTSTGSYDKVTYCSVCNEELGRETITLDIVDHNIESHDAKDPTCNSIGWNAYESCTNCDYTTYCEIPALTHEFEYTVEGVLVYNVSDNSYEGILVTKKCVLCLNESTIDEYTVNLENSSITVDGVTITVAISLNYVGGEHTLAGGSYESITLDGATLNVTEGIVTKSISATNGAHINFVGGESVVNGNITNNSCFLLINNNAILTVNGKISEDGTLFESEDGEFNNVIHRIFVREGTLNVTGNPGADKGLIETISLQVGSVRDNTKGYLNVNSAAGNGIQINVGDANIARYVIANGEANIIGTTEGKKSISAFRFAGGHASICTRYLDVLSTGKLTVKNFEEIAWNSYGSVQLDFCPDSIVADNLDNIIYNRNDFKSCMVYVYTHSFVEAFYTDANGKSGLASLLLTGKVAEYGRNAKAQTMESIGFPNADTVASWSGEIELIEWLAHTHDFEYGMEGTVIYNAADGTYDASSVKVGAICKECGFVNSDEYTIDVSNVLSEGAFVVLGNDRIAIPTSLNFAGGEHTITSGNFETITISGATVNVDGNMTAKSLTLSATSYLNFIGGNSVINGNVASAASFILIKNGAVLTVEGGNMTVEGDLASDSSAENGYNHRLTVLDGTLNINSTKAGAAAILTNSIQVGSLRDDLKGYLNVNTAGNGVQIVSGNAGRWTFYNGEMNFTGSITDGTSTYDVLEYPGNKDRFTDIEVGMKFTASNFRSITNNQYGNVYFGFYTQDYTLENVQYMFRDQNTGSKYTYVYVSNIVQVEYTDAEGKTGLANVKCSGLLSKFKNGSIASFADTNYPTAENYENWTEGKEFISWVE